MSIDTLRHMLGLTRSKTPYRNYYCANPNDNEMRDLQAAGLVEKYAERDGYEWFRCTAAGIAAASAQEKQL